MCTNRCIPIDFIKVCALFLVISVHFVSFISKWLINMESSIPIIAISVYLISDCCVPLFIMCSGFLLGERELSWKRHYSKIWKVLSMYLFASFICGCYRGLMGESFKSILLGIIKFSTAPYSWYVKYYLLLFLLIPILNWIYKKTSFKELLIISLFVGGVIGSYGRYTITVESSKILLIIFKILKNLFMPLYYLMGLFFREYLADKKLKISIVWICLIGFLTLTSTGMFLKYKNHSLVVIPNGYGIWYIVVLSVLLFTLLFYYAPLVCSKDNKIWINISNCTLIAYLVSYISDDITRQMTKRMESAAPFWLYFICVPIGFTLSILVGYIGNKVINILVQKVWKKLY